MPKYKLKNGSIVDTTNYDSIELEYFLGSYPDAVLVSEDFQNGVAETDASAIPVNNQASNGDSALENGSSELPKYNAYRIGGKEVSEVEFEGSAYADRPMLKEDMWEIDGTKYYTSELESSMGDVDKYVNSLRRSRKHKIKFHKFEEINREDTAIGTDVTNELDEVVVKAERPDIIEYDNSQGGTSYISKENLESLEQDIEDVDIATNLITDEELLDESVNKYFDLENLDNRDKTKKYGSAYDKDLTFIPVYKTDEDYNDYLKERMGDRYEDYLEYKEDPAEFGKKLLASGDRSVNDAKDQLKKGKAERAMRNYSEDRQDDMKALINYNTPFKTPEQQKVFWEREKANLDNQVQLIDAGKFKVQELDNQFLITERRTTLENDLKVLQDKYYYGIDENASPEDIDKYNSIIEQYKILQEDMASSGILEAADKVNRFQDQFQENLKNFAKKSEDINNLNIAKSALDMDYRNSTRVLASFENLIGGGVEGLIGGLGDIAYNIGSSNYISLNPSTRLGLMKGKGLSDWALNSAEERSERLARTVPKATTFSDVDKGASYGDLILETFSDNAASTAMSLLPVGAGLMAGRGLSGVAAIAARKAAVRSAGNLTSSTFFVSAFGNKYTEVGVLQREAYANIKKLKERLLMGDLGTVEKRSLQMQIDRYQNAIDTSTAAKAFSAFTHGVIEFGAEKLGSLKFIESLQDTSSLIGINPFKAAYRVGRKTAEGILIENTEEVITQLGQNGVDIVVLGENKSLIEGINPEFFLGTTLSSLAISGPSMGQNLYNIVADQVKTTKEVKATRDLVSEYNQLQNDKLNFKTNSAGRRKILKRQREILKEAGYQKALSISKLNALDAKGVEDLFQANTTIKQQQRILEEAAASGLKPNNPVVIAALDKIEKLNEYRTELLNTNETQVIEYLEQFDSKGQSERIYLETYAKFQDQLLRLNVKKGTKIYQATTIEELQEQIKDLSEDKQKAIIKEWEGGPATVLDGVVIINNSIRTNNIAQAALLGRTAGKFAAVVATHELLHLRTQEAGLLKDKDIKINFQGAVLGLKDILANKLETADITAEDYQMLIDRAETYERLSESGEVTNPVEELINLYHDAVELGIVDLPGLSASFGIKSLLNSIGRKFMGDSWQFDEFNTAEDVLNYLKKFNQDVRAARLNSGVAEPEEENKKSLGLDKSQRQLSDVKDKLKALGKDITSAKAQRVIAQVLPEMARVQVDNRFNLSDTKAEDLAVDAVGRIYLAGETTKWDGRGQLYGFLNGRIAKRILDAVRKNPKYLENIDSNQFDALEKAANVIDDSFDDEAIAEAPAYVKLTNSNVISKGSINDIKNDLITIVRVLKTRIDANQSLNAKIAPVIADLKKSIGKSLIYDKIISTMGGLKNDQLKNFLIKNKQAILENMTTTWLMTAIPSAVKKQVDGKLTLDWAGKKIDREKTTTDNAGRTSGDDIVVRVKNMAEFSDEVFLSYMFDDSGKIIRGRKESLGKALAEEIGFEVLANEVMTPNTPLNLALSENQKMLGAITGEALINDLVSKIERGNKKYSLGLPVIKTGLKDLMYLALEDSLRGVQGDRFNTLYEDSDPIIQKLWDDNLAITFAPNVGGFKDTLKKWSDKEIPKELKPFIDQYFEAYTFKDQKLSKTDPKAIKEYKKFAKKLVEILPKSLLDKIGGDIYGSHDRVLGTKEGTFGRELKNFIANKKETDVELPYNVDHLELFQSGTGLMKEIETNILFKDFPTAQAKYDAFVELYKDRVDNANAANKAALEYILTSITNAVGLDITLLPGYIRYLESNTNLGRGMRALSGLKDIEFYAENQAPFISKDRKQGYRGLSKPLKEKYENNEITLNNFHPLISEARAFAIRKNKERKEKGKKIIPITEFKIASYLRNKGEHTNPSANFSIDVLKEQLPLIALLHNNKNEIAKGTIISYSILKLQKLVEDFDQQLNSKLLSDIQDRKLGSTSNLGDLRLFSVGNKMSKGLFDTKGIGTINRGIDQLNTIIDNIDIKGLVEVQTKEKAILNGKKSLGLKGISVWDFDDTLATSKSMITVSLPGKKPYKIDPEQFAKQSEALTIKGAKFDFSEFSKVMQGAKGPMFEKAIARNKKFGNSNVYILTARPANSAKAIHEFLKGIGLDIRLENIFGLSDGRPQAKADWVISKVAEGYNDFYFADDVYKNVKAVQDALDTFDVKGKTQQARKAYSLGLSQGLNEMIERNTGIKAEAMFSRIVARNRGANKGKFKYFISASADDFRGLTQYTFAGKGKQGDLDQQFLEENLVKPYLQGINSLEQARQALKNDYKALLKNYPDVKKKLSKMMPTGDYTFDQAIRVYLWTKAGYSIPGLSKRDQKFLVSEITKDNQLLNFAETALLITKNDKWVKPGSFWNAGSVLSDLNNVSDELQRSDFLSTFIENVDNMFNEANLNKIEAVYGTKHRDALENIIKRMKSGSNRPASSGNKAEGLWLDWVNNSVGTIMFFNRRSALMQLLSTVNFVNWSDNNPAKAALAFANQPQYWKDFVYIFNSDKLKQRRGGLKSDVQEQEIANAARGAKNKPKAIISYLLKIGFTPTQIADSFAISAGGASFYRNRINKYKKEGFTLAEAETKAFEDFSTISDETQQSGDPMLISSQQASHLGRLILAFQNTPMQYTRLMKKAGQDLINGRGDWKTNVSKIAYYGAIQNFIFSALSNAVFALIPGFDDEDESEEDALASKENKASRILQSMLDTILRGSGLAGAVVSTLKNTIMEYYKQDAKGFTADQTYTILQLANISPPIGSKLRKVYSAMQTKKFEKDVISERGLDITIDGKFNLSPGWDVLGNLTSAFLNLPLDRLVQEINGISEALDARNTQWQRIALALGWRTWGVNAKDEEEDIIKAIAKYRKKEAGKAKAKETREKNKNTIKSLEKKLLPSQYRKYKAETKGMSISKRIEYLKKNK